MPGTWESLPAELTRNYESGRPVAIGPIRSLRQTLKRTECPGTETV
jgi:hypothetical protein